MRLAPFATDRALAILATLAMGALAWASAAGLTAGPLPLEGLAGFAVMALIVLALWLSIRTCIASGAGQSGRWWTGLAAYLTFALPVIARGYWYYWAFNTRAINLSAPLSYPVDLAAIATATVLLFADAARPDQGGWNLRGVREARLLLAFVSQGLILMVWVGLVTPIPPLIAAPETLYKGCAVLHILLLAALLPAGADRTLVSSERADGEAGRTG